MNNQIKQLKKISENIVFYKQKDLSIDETGNFEEEIKKFPVVNKQLIKQDQKSFISYSAYGEEYQKIFQDKKYIFDKKYIIGGQIIIAEYTSGTTGSPFIVLKTKSERLKLGMNLWKLRNQHTKVDTDEMFDFIHSASFRNVKFDPHKNRRLQELEFLSKSKYTWWHITSRLLEEYKSLVVEHNIKFSNLRVIENNGSYISPEEKIEYEKIFNCKIVDNYGSREVWTIAYSCPQGNLHVNSENVYFELLDENGNEIKEDNVPGYVTLTSIKLSLMPFVRYQIGDVAEYIPCDCGCQNRAIKIVPGRNYIKGTNLYGNKYFKDIVLGLALRFNIKDYDSITVVQDDYNHFRVNIVNNREKKEMLEKAFRAASELVFGHCDFEYEFTYDNEERRKSIFTVIF